MAAGLEERDSRRIAARNASPPSPAPTVAPLARGEASGVGLKVKVRGEQLAERLVGRGLGDTIVLGPFEARGEQDVDALRKEIGLDTVNVKGGNAAQNAKHWLASQQQAGLPGDRMTVKKRQTAEEEECFVGNDQLSCYPPSGQQVKQGTWSKLIWNTNYPDFTNNGGYVDVYLFQQDTDRVATSWTSLPNAQGRLSFNPGDSWWQGRTAADNFNGTDIAWPFYFVITYSGQGLDGTTNRLSTWYAVQTQLPAAIASARLESSASVYSASLASAASAATQSAASITGSATSALPSSDAAALSSFAASLTSALVSSLTAQGKTGTETLQGTATTTLPDGRIVTATATGQANGQFPPGLSGDQSTLPGYAIALIVIFGFLALVGAFVGLYFLLAAARKRRERQTFEESSRTGSNAPMINHGEYHYSDEPLSPTGTTAGHMREVQGAAVVGRSVSTERQEQDIPFSSNEASRMAEAFRAALREPSFASGALEDEDATQKRTLSHEDDGGVGNAAANDIIREELRAEGHDLHQVGERRRPEVHD